jgi:hypothetical protein
MDVVEKIGDVEKDRNDKPKEPIVMETVEIFEV